MKNDRLQGILFDADVIITWEDTPVTSRRSRVLKRLRRSNKTQKPQTQPHPQLYIESDRDRKQELRKALRAAQRGQLTPVKTTRRRRIHL